MSQTTDEDYEKLLDHLVRTTQLERGQAVRVVAEVLSFYAELPEAFVIRRHRELREERKQNAEIFAQVRLELGRRRFVAPEWSDRQLRRLVYG